MNLRSISKDTRPSKKSSPTTQKHTKCLRSGKVYEIQPQQDLNHQNMPSKIHIMPQRIKSNPIQHSDAPFRPTKPRQSQTLTQITQNVRRLRPRQLQIQPSHRISTLCQTSYAIERKPKNGPPQKKKRISRITKPSAIVAIDISSSQGSQSSQSQSSFHEQPQRRTLRSSNRIEQMSERLKTLRDKGKKAKRYKEIIQSGRAIDAEGMQDEQEQRHISSNVIQIQDSQPYQPINVPSLNGPVLIARADQQFPSNLNTSTINQVLNQQFFRPIGLGLPANRTNRVRNTPRIPSQNPRLSQIRRFLQIQRFLQIRRRPINRAMNETIVISDSSDEERDENTQRTNVLFLFKNKQYTSDQLTSKQLENCDQCSICHQHFVEPLEKVQKGQKFGSIKNNIKMKAQQEKSKRMVQQSLIEVTQVMQLFCGHFYHTNCITRWLLTQKPVCPFCRKDFRLHSADKADKDRDIQQQKPNGSPNVNINQPINQTNTTNRIMEVTGLHEQRIYSLVLGSVEQQMGQNEEESSVSQVFEISLQRRQNRLRQIEFFIPGWNQDKALMENEVQEQPNPDYPLSSFAPRTD